MGVNCNNMRKELLLLLLVLHVPAWGSQIVVGLASDNLVSWSVWERKGNALKHYLLLYNKGPQQMEVKIKLRRFSSDGSQFTNVPTNQTFFHVAVGARQLVRLKYPKKQLGLDFMEYFENGQSIGLLPASTDRPGKAVLNNQYRFYTNQGANSGQMGYWLAFESIDAPPTRLVLTAADPFYPASETLKEEYCLVKLYAGFKAGYPQPGVLDSLVTAGAGASIVRLDLAHPSALMPVGADVAAPGFSTFGVCVERVENYLSYDEARRLVPRKSIGGRVVFIPVFPATPGSGRR